MGEQKEQIYTGMHGGITYAESLQLSLESMDDGLGVLGRASHRFADELDTASSLIDDLYNAEKQLAVDEAFHTAFRNLAHDNVEGDLPFEVTKNAESLRGKRKHLSQDYWHWLGRTTLQWRQETQSDLKDQKTKTIEYVFGISKTLASYLLDRDAQTLRLFGYKLSTTRGFLVSHREKDLFYSDSDTALAENVQHMEGTRTPQHVRTASIEDWAILLGQLSALSKF